MNIKTLFGSLGGLAAAHAALFTYKAVKSGKESRCDKYCDALIILGSRVDGDTPSDDLKARINRAAEYMKLHPLCIAVATGGRFRDGQKISEAQCIKDGLTALGIAPERILLEEDARTTYENFKNCLAIISSLQKENPVIGILSNEYHIFRAGLIAKDCGIDGAVMIGAETPHPLKGYLRENLVIFEVWQKRLKRILKKLQ